MLKKGLLVFMLFVLFNAMCFGGTEEFEKKLKSITISSALDVKGVKLSEVLTQLSKITNISIVANEDAAKKEVDLYFPPNSTLEKIIETIKTINGFVGEIRGETIVLIGHPEMVRPFPFGKVVGKVLEIDKTTGIKGVTLSLGDDVNTLVMSDIGGSFIMDKVKPGTYILKAVAKGYLANSEIIEVKPNKECRTDMTLQKISMKSGSTSRNMRMQVVTDKGDTAQEYSESPQSAIVSIRAPEPMLASGNRRFNTEEYKTINENEFLESATNPLSTFSIDVDKAAYANVRRFINSNQMPQTDAVRVEEMINYFDYTYKQPDKGEPFSINMEYSKCPWNNDNKLLLIGLKGKEIDNPNIPSNLTFLIDVSGSMGSENKLPLIKKSLKLLVENLKEQDRVAIVVYASSEGVALPSTSGKDKEKIIAVIDSLGAGGSTAGGAGITKAYAIAKENFIKDANNRIILATDGDFNVGISSTSEMVKMIEEKRKDGVFLTIIGVGDGNFKDSHVEEMADKGNGNYYYIDNILEAKKVFVDELNGTLFTIAKDVKIQVEFNPAKVKSYRLIGYENRALKKEDFADDKKDAGEMGAGHTVTAIYEIEPSKVKEVKFDGLKYQTTIIREDAYKTDELLTVNLRYKNPDEEKSKLLTKVCKESEYTEITPENLMFASSVAEFSMLLRGSKYKGSSSYDNVIELAKKSKGEDKYGYRNEFIMLAEKAKLLSGK